MIRAAQRSLGYALAIGAWSVSLVVFPPFAAYALAQAKSRRDFDAFLADAERAARELQKETR